MKTIKALLIFIFILPIYILSIFFKRRKSPPLLWFLNFLLVRNKEHFIKNHRDTKFTFFINIKRLEEFNKISLPSDIKEKRKLIHKKQLNFKKINQLKKDLKTLEFLTQLLISFRYEKEE